MIYLTFWNFQSFLLIKECVVSIFICKCDKFSIIVSGLRWWVMRSFTRLLPIAFLILLSKNLKCHIKCNGGSTWQGCLLPTFGPTGKGGCGGWGNHESMFLVNGCLFLSLDVIFHLVHGLTFTNMITVALAVKTNSKAQCSSIHILFIGLVWQICYRG